MILIGDKDTAKKVIKSSKKLVNISAIRKSGAVGHDLPFLFEIRDLLEQMNINEEITIQSFRYPYTTVAELLYFHLEGTSINTQNKILDVLGIDSSNSFHTEKYFKNLTIEAKSFQINNEQFKEIISLTLDQLNETKSYKSEVIDHCLTNLKTEINNLEYCISLLGETFINLFYKKNNYNSRLKLKVEYTSHLLELDKINPKYYVDNNALKEQIEKKYLDLKNFNNRFSDRLFSLYSLIDSSRKTNYPLKFNTKERIECHLEKEYKRYKDIKERFSDNLNIQDINSIIYCSEKQDYESICKRLYSLLLPTPVQKLRLIRKFRKHSSILKDRGDIPYISGKQIVEKIIEYGNNNHKILINQNFENRNNQDLVSLFKNYKFPFIQAPPNNYYKSHNNNFVFGVLDIQKN